MGSGFAAVSSGFAVLLRDRPRRTRQGHEAGRGRADVAIGFAARMFRPGSATKDKTRSRSRERKSRCGDRLRREDVPPSLRASPRGSMFSVSNRTRRTRQGHEAGSGRADVGRGFAANECRSTSPRPRLARTSSNALRLPEWVGLAHAAVRFGRKGMSMMSILVLTASRSPKTCSMRPVRRRSPVRRGGQQLRSLAASSWTTPCSVSLLPAALREPV